MTTYEATLMRQSNDRLRVALAGMDRVIAQVRRCTAEAIEQLDAAQCCFLSESAMHGARVRVESDCAEMIRRLP